MLNTDSILFLSLSKQEKAQIIFEMVDELMRETHLPKEICIAMVADYKNYSIFQIENFIKIANPDFYYYAVFYDEQGKLVLKHQVEQQTIRAIKKNLMEVILQHPFEINELCDLVKETLRDYYESLDWSDICHQDVNIINQFDKEEI